MSRASRASAPTAEISYEDYMAMPESNLPVEVIDGVLIQMPTPTYDHQDVQGNLFVDVRAHVKAMGLGLVMMAPADLIIRKQPKLRIRQPDVMFFSNARAGFDCAVERTRLFAEMIPPDLAVEVLSPRQNERTLAEKLRDYASIGIPEVWFVDQSTRSVRVLGIDGDGYRLVGDHGVGDRVASAALPGLDLPVANILP